MDFKEENSDFFVKNEEFYPQFKYALDQYFHF